MENALAYTYEWRRYDDVWECLATGQWLCYPFTPLTVSKVRDHARKLLEKHIKKPFFDVRYGESVERMSVEDLERGKQWLSDTFYLIRETLNLLCTIKAIFCLFVYG
ncbi:unnamed protein product [Ilex paraguariensis]|uniref:Uncharacterized protein n=1 Tax=Ilex paraguariensis TaxID=185542 RepID=A0ABC8S2M7_9AQUA